jgi:hypothetical protein
MKLVAGTLEFFALIDVLFCVSQLLINYLGEVGHLSRHKVKDDTKMTANEIEFSDKMLLLSDKYYQMTNEETEFLENLYNKYR